MMFGSVFVGVISVLSADVVSFDDSVAPILRTYCVGCHHGDDADGSLDLSSFRAMTAGGENGPVWVAGKSGESRLFQLIAGIEEPRMPPEDQPSPPADAIALIKAWIDQGATPPEDPERLIIADPATPEIASTNPPGHQLFAGAWSPDGTRLALAGYREVLLIDPATQFIEQRLSGLAGAVQDVSFSSDGTLLVTASGIPGVRGEAVVWKLADGSRALEINRHADSLYAARLSPSSEQLVTAGYDRMVRIWNAKTGEPIHQLKGHQESVYAAAFRPDGKLLATVSGDRTLKLWDPLGGDRRDTLSESVEGLSAVAFSPDGQDLFAAGIDHRIRRWRVTPDAAEGSNALMTSQFAHEGGIVRLALSKDGAMLASAGDDRLVKLWRLPEVTEIMVLEPQADWPTALSFSPDGKQLFVGLLTGGATIYDAESGSAVRAITPTEKPPPPPTLVRTLPVPATIGSTIRSELVGTNLARASEVRTNHAGLSATIVASDSPRDDRLTVDVAVTGDVGRGAYELSVVTAGGQTKPLRVEVDELPHAIETEPNQAIDQATPLSLPTVAWGTLSSAGDVDRFTFPAKAGEVLVIDANASAIGSPANLVVAIRDASGRVMPPSREIDARKNPLLTWSAPSDGEFQLEVHDLEFAGSDKHHYRVTVGRLPYVLAVDPLHVPAGSAADIELIGPNIDAGSSVPIAAEGPNPRPVPLDPKRFRWRDAFVVTTSGAVTAEVEPNDEPASATRMALPGDAAGRISTGDMADHFLFSATQGEEWVFEIEGARRGSPIDSRLDIVTTDGTPVERVWLATERDSYVEFRGFDSTNLEIRCKNWREMELNEYVWMSGEVARLFRHPRGPDSGFQFYSTQGKRRAYFDTTNTTHALEDPVYIVRPVPPGTSLVPNGLPVFRLNYSNDDASDHRLQSDSRLTFTAPATGDYVIRVTDTQQRGGPEFGYRLIARPRAPDFRVQPSTRSPAVHRGSGRQIEFIVERIDDFAGSVDIEVEGLPEGFEISRPIRIEPDQERVSAVLTATDKVSSIGADALAALKITARATIAGAEVSHAVDPFQSINVEEDPPLLVRVEPAELTIVPGQTVRAKLIINRLKHEGRVTFEMPGLPHGVIVDNIGLSGILIPENESEREFFLSARPFTPPTSRPFFAESNEAGRQSSGPVILHVRTESEIAKSGE